MAVKEKKPKKAEKASPITCAREMGEKVVLWHDRTPEFKKAYSQFMINRLMTLDSRWLKFLDVIISQRKLSDRQHHDSIVSFINGQGWAFSWMDYQAIYPKNDEKILKAVSLYYEIGSEDAKLMISRMDKKEQERICGLCGFAAK